MDADVFRGAAGGIVKRQPWGSSARPGPRRSSPLLNRTLGHTINVSAPVTRISGSASSDILAAVRDHARLIAEEVGRALENEHMSLAAI
jgi:hypothetical protein